MRRLPQLLITGAVLGPLAACGSGEPSASTPPASSGPPSASLPSASLPAADPPPSGPSSGSSADPPALPPPSRRTSPPGSLPPGSPPPASPPGEGELPGGLPYGERKLTGVLEGTGECLILRVGQRGFRLSGPATRGLAAGARVTVEGQITTAGPDCPAPDVTQAIVARRVRPA